MITPSTVDLLAAFRNCLDAVKDDRVEDFLKDLDCSLSERELPGKALPCLRHLSRLAGIAAPFAADLVNVLRVGRDRFHWGQTYTAADFGERFMKEYGWLEVFGIRGHFRNHAVAAGLLVLGPEIDYPDHHHVAEEIYVPLTPGALWSMAGLPFVRRAAGEIIHHAPNVSHAMRTGAEPLLALYLWRGGPLDQRSVIDGAKT